jgi:hypothetical protein
MFLSRTATSWDLEDVVHGVRFKRLYVEQADDE